MAHQIDSGNEISAPLGSWDLLPDEEGTGIVRDRNGGTLQTRYSW
jgi:hypothetical protein